MDRLKARSTNMLVCTVKSGLGDSSLDARDARLEME